MNLIDAELEYLPSSTHIPPWVTPYLVFDEEYRVLELALINYFISHIDLFETFIIERKGLSILQAELELDPKRNLLIQCGRELSKNPYYLGVLKNYAATDPISKMELDNQIVQFYGKYNKNKPIEDILDGSGDFFITKVVHYFPVLTNVQTKRSDFDISDTFLDMIKTFFMILPGWFEPPVRIFRAAIPEDESHLFRQSGAT